MLNQLLLEDYFGADDGEAFEVFLSVAGSGGEVVEIFEGVDSDQLLIFVRIDDGQADSALNGIFHIHVPIFLPKLISIELLLWKLLVERLSQRLFFNKTFSQQLEGLDPVLIAEPPERVVLISKILLFNLLLLLLFRIVSTNIIPKKLRLSQNFSILLDGRSFVLRLRFCFDQLFVKGGFFSSCILIVNFKSFFLAFTIILIGRQQTIVGSLSEDSFFRTQTHLIFNHAQRICQFYYIAINSLEYNNARGGWQQQNFLQTTNPPQIEMPKASNSRKPWVVFSIQLKNNQTELPKQAHQYLIR